MMDIGACVRHLRPGEAYTVADEAIGYESLVWMDTTPKPTLAELTAVWPAVQAHAALSALRVERNRRLDEADLRYCNADLWSNMTAAQKTAWRGYKQALRDLPATTEDPGNPIWPTQPE